MITSVTLVAQEEVKDTTYKTEVVPLGEMFYNEIVELFSQRNVINARIEHLMNAIREQSGVDTTYQFVQIIPERKAALYVKPKTNN
jgi:hypothetical protein